MPIHVNLCLFHGYSMLIPCYSNATCFIPGRWIKHVSGRIVEARPLLLYAIRCILFIYMPRVDLKTMVVA